MCTNIECLLEVNVDYMKWISSINYPDAGYQTNESIRHAGQASMEFMLLKLNGNREVIGLLRGFDPFMNIVLEECVEVTKSGQQVGIDTVVVRGNSVNVVEILERV
ncbi:unnamed protein product [Dibothriocephalus latus]|uniref:Sm protein G n=1 Tax=Dibothriocephalus latus TaxID=60516 RepID=A0A3P6U526_DIBLA|nr:unnamed protein product [Dibothriocephalus latus]